METSFQKLALNRINTSVFVTLILLEILYLLNRDLLRPSFRTNQIIVVVVLGSLPNFLASFGAGIALLPLCLNWLNKLTGRKVFYSVIVFIQGLLIEEEISPFLFGSRVNDLNDVIASIMGALFAILIYEVLLARLKTSQLTENHSSTSIIHPH